MSEESTNDCQSPLYAILIVCDNPGEGSSNCCESFIDVFEVYKEPATEEDGEDTYHVKRPDGPIVGDSDENPAYILYSGYCEQDQLPGLWIQRDGLDADSIIRTECGCLNKPYCMAMWKADWDPEGKFWTVNTTPEEYGCYECDCLGEEFIEGPAVGKTFNEWEVDCCAGTATYWQKNEICSEEDDDPHQCELATLPDPPRDCIDCEDAEIARVTLDDNIDEWHWGPQYGPVDGTWQMTSEFKNRSGTINCEGILQDLPPVIYKSAKAGYTEDVILKVKCEKKETSTVE